jgi:hypothetical protein
MAIAATLNANVIDTGLQQSILSISSKWLIGDNGQVVWAAEPSRY